MKTPLFDTHPQLQPLWHPTLNTIDPDTVTAKNVSKAYWLCPTYGHPWEAVIRNVAKGSRCGVCKGFQIHRGFNDFASQNPERAAYWDNSQNPKNHEDVHHRSRDKYWFVCENDHPAFPTTLMNVSKGKWCPYCSGRSAVPGVNDLFTLRPDLMPLWSVNNTLDPSSIKVQSNKDALWWCGEHEWSSAVYNIANGNGCPVCAGKVATPQNNLTVTHPDIAKQWHPTKNDYLPETVTYGHSEGVWWACPTNLDHEWTATVYNRTKFQGTDCPDCSYRPDSKPQIELQEIVQNMLPEGTEILKDRETLGGREIDIYIPSLKLGFEFNGTYNHSSARYRRPKMEAEKTALAREKGIRLIHVWDHDWRDNRDITLRQVSQALGTYTGPKVYARKTTVSTITYEEASEFLNLYHIQGKKSGTHYLGLSHDKTIVAVMVLTHSAKTDEMVLDRYATSCSVPGGHSKMISYVEKTYRYAHLTTFADLQHSYGDLYYKTGWVLDKELSPDYKYLYKGKVHHKFSFRLKRFKNDPELTYDPDLTEAQHAVLNNAYRVWDCGKIRFVKPHPNFVVQ